MGRKDQHRFPHRGTKTPDGVFDRVRPLALDGLDKDILSRRILHRDVKMHPRSGIVFIRLGHETRGHTMGAGVHPHDAFQAHQVIRRFHHIVAVMQRHFILAWGKFGNQGFGLDPDQLCRFVDIVEQRQHPVQFVDGINIGFVRRAPIQHIAGGHHFAIGATFIFQQEKFQFKRASRIKPFGGQRIDLRLQGMARV